MPWLEPAQLVNAAAVKRLGRCLVKREFFFHENAQVQFSFSQGSALAVSELRKPKVHGEQGKAGHVWGKRPGEDARRHWEEPQDSLSRNNKFDENLAVCCDKETLGFTGIRILAKVGSHCMYDVFVFDAVSKTFVELVLCIPSVNHTLDDV